MKMLVVMSIKEDLQKVRLIFEKVGVSVFSVSDTTGYSTLNSGDLLNNWFASGKEQTDALFFFSFTENESAEKVLKEVVLYNKEKQRIFPIRAFLLPVEKSSY